MNILLLGASGFIGSSLIYTLEKQHNLILVTRKKKNINTQNHKVITWQELEKNNTILKSVDMIINLCGQSILGIWTESYKKKLINSRVTPLKKIAELLDHHRISVPIISASGIGIYGYQQPIDKQTLPSALTEDSQADHQYFLSEIGHSLENALPDHHQQNTCYLRFGVVLDRSGGSLPLMMFPHHFCLGAVLGSGAQPFSWVSLDDALRAISFAVKHQLSGAYNIAAKTQTAYEFTHDLASAMHRKCFLNCPEFIASKLGLMINNTILRGQHVSTDKIQGMGFKFTKHTIGELI